MPTVTADENGDYTIPDLQTGQWLITPSNPGITFTPTNRTETLTNADLTGVDFTASGPPPSGGTGFGTENRVKKRPFGFGFQF